MDVINREFDIPYYIFEELMEYVEQTAQGRCRVAKWSNILALLRLAVVNGRLSEGQAKHLEQTYCREKD